MSSVPIIGYKPTWKVTNLTEYAREDLVVRLLLQKHPNKGTGRNTLQQFAIEYREEDGLMTIKADQELTDQELRNLYRASKPAVGGLRALDLPR